MEVEQTEVKYCSHADTVTQVSRLELECWLLVSCVSHQHVLFFFYLERNLLDL